MDIKDIDLELELYLNDTDSDAFSDDQKLFLQAYSLVKDNISEENYCETREYMQAAYFNLY